MSDEFKFFLVYRNIVCAPIENQSVGLCVLDTSNQAMLGKWLWRHGVKGTRFWRQVVGLKVWGGLGSMVYIGCKLGSTGAALGVLHLRLTRMDRRAAVDAAACTSEVNPFFFFWFLIQAETAPIWSDSVRIRRGRRKICYQKICEKKKREGEEERSATKWFARKKEKRKEKKKTMWRCGGWSSTAGCYHRNSLLWNFQKGKVWWQIIVDFQIKPWNVILIKQCMWVLVGLGNGASWKLPCL